MDALPNPLAKVFQFQFKGCHLCVFPLRVTKKHVEHSFTTNSFVLWDVQNQGRLENDLNIECPVSQHTDPSAGGSPDRWDVKRTSV